MQSRRHRKQKKNKTKKKSKTNNKLGENTCDISQGHKSLYKELFKYPGKMPKIQLVKDMKRVHRKGEGIAIRPFRKA